MKAFLLITLLTLGSNAFASTQKTMSVEVNNGVPELGYSDPDANSLTNAKRLFAEFGSAVICGANDSALNLYIKRTVGNASFKIISIASTDIQDIGKATCAAIVKP